MQFLMYSEDFLYDLLCGLGIFTIIICAICILIATISFCKINKQQRRFYEKAATKLNKKKAKVELRYED